MDPTTWIYPRRTAALRAKIPERISWLAMEFLALTSIATPDLKFLAQLTLASDFFLTSRQPATTKTAGLGLCL